MSMDATVDGAVTGSNGTTGSLGLKGTWALVGNSTAVVLIAIVMFLGLFQVRTMHTEGMAILERLHQQQQQYDSQRHEQERSFNRQQIELLLKTIDKNTQALESLALEIRTSRLRPKD